ncbi:hypothetical protein EVA_08361 [gut metagenome]|uniref:Uncharacterized protein n=1 Tax=gut metagenome TaxID=749906 RepID=J9GTB9_9ZZZZ
MEKCSVLLTQIEGVNQSAVSIDVGTLEVVKQLATTRDHAKKAATGMMILGVDLEVVRKVVDAGGQKSNLHFGRSRVAFSALELGNDLRLVHFNGHLFSRNKKNEIETCGHER